LAILLFGVFHIQINPFGLLVVGTLICPMLGISSYHLAVLAFVSAPAIETKEQAGLDQRDLEWVHSGLARVAEELRLNSGIARVAEELRLILAVLDARLLSQVDASPRSLGGTSPQGFAPGALGHPNSHDEVLHMLNSRLAASDRAAEARVDAVLAAQERAHQQQQSDLATHYKTPRPMPRDLPKVEPLEKDTGWFSDWMYYFGTWWVWALCFVLDICLWMALQFFFVPRDKRRRNKSFWNKSNGMIRSASSPSHKARTPQGLGGLNAPLPEPSVTPPHEHKRLAVLSQEDVLVQWLEEYSGKIGLSVALCVISRILPMLLGEDGFCGQLVGNLVVMLRCLAVVTFFLQDDMVLPQRRPKDRSQVYY
jgi:hypothetical protein